MSERQLNFGENWDAFSRHALTTARVAQARAGFRKLTVGKSIVARTGLTLGLLVVLIWRTDVGAIAATLHQVSFSQWLVAFAMFIVAAVIAAVKWKLLLPRQPLATLLKLNFIAQFYSLFLPGQIAGEAVKAYRLGKGRSDAERIAASIAFDRLTGLIGLILVALVGLALSAVPVRAQILFTFGSVTALLVLIFFIFRSSIWIHLLVRLEQRGPHCRRIAARVHNGLEAWRAYAARPFVILGSVAIGAVFQLVAVLINYQIGEALGVQLPFVDWCWIFGIVSVAVVLPFTIGGIGLREGSFAGALALIGIGPERAIAISFAVFSLSVAGALIGGALSWTRSDHPIVSGQASDDRSETVAGNG